MKSTTNETITPLVTVVIPAFNEEGRISNVLKVLYQVKPILEIIVVDDGSKDSTVEEVTQAAASDPRIKLICHETNMGKGEAIITGSLEAKTPYLLFLDSDLMNLKPGNILDLMGPVLAGKADMTLGLFLGGRLNTDIPHWVNPSLTGQRCLRADLIPHIPSEASKGYGIETAITISAYRLRYRVKIVPLKGVWHPPSELHRGFFTGMAWRANMYAEILQAWKAGKGYDILTERIIYEPTQQMKEFIGSRYRKVKSRAVAILRR